MKKTILLSFALLLAATPLSPAADTIYVGPGYAYNTIQAAINAARDGDTVIVAPGTYTGDGNRDIDFLGKAITVRSTDPNDALVVAATVINCERKGRGFYFHSGEEFDSVIAGITVTGGYASYGGGIYCQNNSNLMILHCIIANNWADSYGGGIYCKGSNPTIKYCTIKDNRMGGYGDGGGISCSEGSVTISNCMIIGNRAGGTGGWGGAINCRRGSSAVVRHCTIKGNYADKGGAFGEGSSTVSDTIIWGNSARLGPVAYRASLAVSYSDVQGGWSGKGNINAGPRFVDAAGGDYHLHWDSPCVNAGDPAYSPSPGETDIDGDPRVMMGCVDMGADECVPETPFIEISPIGLVFRADEGGSNPSEQILSIRNIGVGVLNWEVTEDCLWLEAMPANGQSTGEVDEVTLTIDISGLSLGLHNCELTVISDGTVNSPQPVSITLYIGDSNGKLDVPSEFGTIQEAIDFATNGEVIIVAEGTYTGEGNFNVDFKGKAITVQSANPCDSAVVAATVIDCEGNGRGFYFHNGEGADSVLTGLTITNGYASSGGGIYCKDSTPTISYCNIISNTISSINCNGGGIFCNNFNNNSNLTINHCTITHNSTIGSNRWGGGICCFYGNVTISHCTISGNSALKGGGIYSFYTRPTVSHCILWGDTAGYGSPELGMYSTSSGFRVRYSDVQGGWVGEGNIAADPLFVNPTSGDYHLLPSSPCIDAGDPKYVPEPEERDIDGQPRIWDGRVDMGADEFVPMLEVAMKFTPQVLNPDSQGKWVKAHLVLPDGFAVEDVDVNTPAKLCPLGIESDYINVFINEDDLVEIEIGFGRAAFCGRTDYGPADVTVIGLLTTGQYFYGTDTIRIIADNLKYLAVFASYWLDEDCGAPDWCSGFDLDRDSVVNFVDFAMFDSCCVEIITQ